MQETSEALVEHFAMPEAEPADAAQGDGEENKD